MLVRRKALLLIVAVCTVPFTSAKPTDAESTNATKPPNSEDRGRTSNHSQVLIIGAGPSGVAAASRLLENGVMDVRILEAENRIGGRTYTVPFAGHVVDMGAQWVHGAGDNVVFQMANPLGLLRDDGATYEDNMQFLHRGGVIPDQNAITLLKNIFDEIRGNNESLNQNGTVGQYFTRRFDEYLSNTPNVTVNPSLLKSFLSWADKTIAFEVTDLWDNVAARIFANYRIYEGSDFINWINNGYGSVIDLLTKRNPNPEQELPVRQKTKLNTEAKTIHWGPKGVVGPTGKQAVLVETSNGERYTADFVIVTVSLGVLKENLNSLFDPPLPAIKVNAIQHIGFGLVDKLFLQFPEVWWPADVTGFSIMEMEDDRQRFNEMYPEYSSKGDWLSGLTGYYTVTRQPLVLFDWIVAEHARNMEKYSDDEVKTGMVKWLEMFLNRTLPAPVAFARSKWYSNPHFRGSYSYRSLDTFEKNARNDHIAEPLLGPDGNPELLFAGEVTNQDRFSTVDGAIETGWREADRILNLLGLGNNSRKSDTVS